MFVSKMTDRDSGQEGKAMAKRGEDRRFVCTMCANRRATRVQHCRVRETTASLSSSYTDAWGTRTRKTFLMPSVTTEMTRTPIESLGMARYFVEFIDDHSK